MAVLMARGRSIGPTVANIMASSRTVSSMARAFFPSLAAPNTTASSKPASIMVKASKSGRRVPNTMENLGKACTMVLESRKTNLGRSLSEVTGKQGHYKKLRASEIK